MFVSEIALGVFIGGVALNLVTLLFSSLFQLWLNGNDVPPRPVKPLSLGAKILYLIGLLSLLPVLVSLGFEGYAARGGELDVSFILSMPFLFIFCWALPEWH